jgi:hypothetical protein
MSTTIDNFTKKLHDNLEAVEDRTKSLKKSIQSVTKKSQFEIQLRLDEVKANLDAKKQEFEDYRAKLRTQFEEKEAEVKLNVEEWKAGHEFQKLEQRANRAEDYANTAIAVARATIEEAEEATLRAITARLDAEAKTEAKQKSKK